MAYNKYTWTDGEYIYPSQLNHIENGIHELDEEYTPYQWASGALLSSVRFNHIEDGVYALHDDYEKTNWQRNDIITAERLNHIEDNIYLPVVENCTTVVYTDGTFIINEPESQREGNILLHGEVRYEYPAWDGEENDYVFSTEEDRPWHSITHSTAIQTTIIGSNIKPTSIAYWFQGFEYCTSFDLSNLDTSSVTDMKWAFNGCIKITQLDVSNFDTSNVIDMERMFGWCTKLTSLDLANFDTSNVTAMNEMFTRCDVLTMLDLSSFNTENVTNMASMFSSVGLVTLDISNFDTSRVTDMTYMFRNAKSLVTIYATSSFVVGQVTSSTQMFYQCSKLKGGAGTTYDSSYIDKTYAKLDGGTNDKGYFTLGGNKFTVLYTDGTFIINEPKSQRASNVQAHGAVTNLYPAFDSTYVPYVFTASNARPWYDQRLSITSVIVASNIQPTSMRYWFDNLQNCASFDLAKLNTSNVTDMRHAFASIKTAITINVSNFNTANVTNMERMFSSCTNITGITFSSNFTTANVTSMVNMFVACKALTSLDLSSFNTLSVTDVLAMFNECENLVTIYATSAFDVSGATTTGDVFYKCWELVGGAGTVFNSNYIDKTRAKVDGGVGNEGYFTAAS